MYVYHTYIYIYIYKYIYICHCGDEEDGAHWIVFMTSDKKVLVEQKHQWNVPLLLETLIHQEMIHLCIF